MNTRKAGRDAQGIIIRCNRKSCGQIVARLPQSDAQSFWHCQSDLSVRCLACRATCTADTVWGRFVAEVVCNAKCTGAVRNICDCSCGGENHGGGMARVA